MTVFALKRAYEPPEAGDGTRVLVDRLWPRGIAKDKARIDVWLKDIAPSHALRRRFHGKPEDWGAFCAAYAAELEGAAARAAVTDLLGRLCRGSVTLLYAARDERRNNAAALKAWLERHGGTGAMSGVRPTVLHGIGGTSLLALRNVVPGNGARILVKLESENPTGSMKDRMALAMIEAAEADGRLAPGGRVVEYTGGSTGVSLALVCAVKGHPLDIVTSGAFAREKLEHMRVLGARLHVVPSEGGRMTETLTRTMIEAARVIAAETGAFWTDQMNNRDALAAYRRMAEEIWAQTEGRIDGFVQSVGTAASLRGNAEALRRRSGRIAIAAVEPAELPVLSGGPTGAHRIDGIGAGYVVPLWRPDLADRIERVSTDEAAAMTDRLAREEGLFGGTSTGANVVAALRMAEEMGADATIVTVMCDTGMKYLSRR